MRNKFLAVLAALALVAITAVAARASIPAQSGSVNGCYTTSTLKGVHGLGVVDSTSACPSGTVALNWSQTGPQGPVGPQGPTGMTGPQGPAGISNYTIVQSVDDGSSTTWQVSCPAGLVELGGGWDNNGQATTVNSDAPLSAVPSSGGQHGWIVSVGPGSNVTGMLVWAICAKVG